MPINFAQNGVVARLRDCNHAIDAFDVVKLNGQSLGHDGVYTQVRRCEHFFHSLDRARFARKPSVSKSVRLAPADKRRQHFDESLLRVGGEQSPLEPAQAEYFPDKVDVFADPNILQNVLRLNGGRNPGEKVIVQCDVLPLHDRRGAKKPPCHWAASSGFSWKIRVSSGHWDTSRSRSWFVQIERPTRGARGRFPFFHRSQEQVVSR